MGSGNDNRLYSKRKCKYVRVHVEVFVNIMDQPEKRRINGILLGNSKYCPKWHTCCSIKYSSSKLPSCQSCFTNLLSNENENQCFRCGNWDIYNENGIMMFPVPNHYPLEDEMLSPFELNYEVLLRIKSSTHNNIANGKWNKTEAEVYLTLHGINKKQPLQLSHMELMKEQNNYFVQTSWTPFFC